jgi:hypothetical protein
MNKKHLLSKEVSTEVRKHSHRQRINKINKKFNKGGREAANTNKVGLSKKYFLKRKAFLN